MLSFVKEGDDIIRFRINLIQEPTPITLLKDTCEPPRLVLEGLHILNLDEEDVAWLCGLDLKWAGEVVDLREIDVFDVVGRIVVLDLAAGPVETFDFDDFVVGDFGVGGDCLFFILD